MRLSPMLDFRLGDVVLLHTPSNCNKRAEKLIHSQALIIAERVRKGNTQPHNIPRYAGYWDTVGLFTRKDEVVCEKMAGKIKKFSVVKFSDYYWDSDYIVLRPNLPRVQREMSGRKALELLKTNTPLHYRAALVLSELFPFLSNSGSLKKRASNAKFITSIYEHIKVPFSDGNKVLSDLQKSPFFRLVNGSSNL